MVKKRRLRRRPTGRAWGLLACGTALFVLATHFSSNAVFLLAFFCIALPLCAPIAVWSAPARVNLHPLPPDPVAAGDNAMLRFRLTPALNGPAQLGVQTAFGMARTMAKNGEWAINCTDLPRGTHMPGPVQIVAFDALGLVRVARDPDPDEARALRPIVVYPRPDWTNPAPPLAQFATGQRTSVSGEPSGLRPYRPGDMRRSIDWRATARAQGLMVREYEQGAEEKSCIFDLGDVPDAGLEATLSRLSAGVLEAARNGSATGLRLPGLDLAPKRGPVHLTAILQALSRYHHAKNDAIGTARK